MKKENIFLVAILSTIFLYGFLYGESSIFPNTTVWYGVLRHIHGGAFAGAGLLLFITWLRFFNLQRAIPLFTGLKSYLGWMFVVGIVWELFEYYLFVTQSDLLGRAQDVNPFLGTDFPIDIVSDLTGSLLVFFIYGIIKMKKSSPPFSGARIAE